ncbi:hypothetical protein ETAA8_07710 [Anatilimnocola aggregata]|uniref:Uncharacterized protein n=1 Tax=Anatilimnocola aggregata TaxID=2528021 RepID=A0A517Y641_9BACT|nr:hypothetical protein [Anatilimnocola aggregata]QDU25701.1 hypothetical protein ETAA8_07710 [Anatilimnocola aggregata]
MNAAVLLVAVLLGADNVPPETAEELRPFTLDQIAAGARNDAFVDEFLKDQTLQLFGTVKLIERLDTDAKKDGEKKESGYRVIFERLGHEDRAVDVTAGLYFPASARKDLATLEPGRSKVTIEGTCFGTQLQSLDRGVAFILELKDCKLVETPGEFSDAPPPSKPKIIPNPTIAPPFPPGIPAPPIPPAPRQE